MMTPLKNNEYLWNKCSILPDKIDIVSKLCQRMLLNRKRYEDVGSKMNCPWWMIGSIHNLEGGMNFYRQLYNGEFWNEVTTLVPKGLGPWKSWEESTIGALHMFNNCMHMSIPELLTLGEKHNGLGMYNRGIPSPYIWSMTNNYTKGKYVSDHKFDPEAVSSQVGVAAVLRCLIDIKVVNV